MKRVCCLCLALVFLFSLGIQAFADEVLYCRMCGKQIPADSKVCQYCGEKVIHTDDASQAASETAAASNAAKPEASPAADTSAAAKAPSPATAAAVPGPFNTTSGGITQPGKVRVTKSPTSESVPYGGSCIFIAHADNATSVTWYIANADASLITTAAEAPRRVAGLYVSGSSSDTLSLSGIPSWMNGCQVQACFTGEGGPVYTEAARIWTYQPAQQKCNWSVWDWYNSCYWYDPGCWYDPCYWDYPWYWDYPSCDSPNPPPPDVSRAYTDWDGTSVAPPIRPGEYVEPAVVVSHTHEPGIPGAPSAPSVSDPGPGPAPDPGPATGIILPDPSASAEQPVMKEPDISGLS